MKKLFIVANWKSNKTSNEAKEWLYVMHDHQQQIPAEKEVIVCPPFTLLPIIKGIVDDKYLPFKLGSQDFSPTDAGAHTGEEPPTLLQEYITYTIIGHSERRRDQQETENLIEKKVAEAIKLQVTPILCIQGLETPIPQGVTMIAYEPIFAIGSGHPDTPEDAEQVAKTIKEKYGIQHVLYGGSVNLDNVHTFTQMSSIDGVLVGGASLDPKLFIQLLINS